MKVFYRGLNSQQMAYEVEARGHYCNAIIKSLSNKYYIVSFMDPVRAQQDLGNNKYFTERGLILLPQVTKELIEIAIENLSKENFFLQYKELTIEEVNSLLHPYERLTEDELIQLSRL